MQASAMQARIVRCQSRVGRGGRSHSFGPRRGAGRQGPGHTSLTRPILQRSVRQHKRNSLLQPGTTEEESPTSSSGSDPQTMQSVLNADLQWFHNLPKLQLPQMNWLKLDGEPQDDSYAELAGEYDLPKLEAFFSRRPAEVAQRLAAISSVCLRVYAKWNQEDSLPPEQRTRGQVLCDAISELGPVFVKCGQTMSQRVDVIGQEAADALKQLQQMNKPFPDEDAHQTILDDLKHDGPLAPNFPPGVEGEPLFAEFQVEHIASASLGQVYRARTHDGRDVAVKVLRPNVLKQVAGDMFVLRQTLRSLASLWGSNVDLAEIADEIGVGVFRELDYWREAANAKAFNDAHAFLGFVRAPLWLPEYTGPQGVARVLTLEWVHGAHLAGLDRERQLLMTRLMVQSSVAQLMRTGMVHADPHEGNIMLDDQDRLVYLDFGLMTTVQDDVMEAFASGVCNMLAGRWTELAYDFQKCGIVPAKGFFRQLPVDTPGEAAELVPITAEQFGAALQEALEAQDDGKTRFGALAPGLGGMSKSYKLITPPYIILLCRTFLTLEGIAGRVDPSFSVYIASLPYAVRRALSPTSEHGKQVLRAALLTESGDFKFNRLREILGQLEDLGGGEDEGGPAEEPSSRPPPEDPAPAPPPEPAAPDAMLSGMSTVSGLLGAEEGAALRRVMYDSNSTTIAAFFASSDAKLIRRMGASSLAASVATTCAHVARHITHPFRSSPPLQPMPAPEPDVQLPPGEGAVNERESKRAKRVLNLIVKSHLQSMSRSTYALVMMFSVGVRVLMRAAFLFAKDAMCAALGWLRALGRSSPASSQDGKPSPSPSPSSS